MFLMEKYIIYINIMKNNISYKKLSKKKQKEINKQKRRYWIINPETRVVINKKEKYNKKFIENEIEENLKRPNHE